MSKPYPHGMLRWLTALTEPLRSRISRPNACDFERNSHVRIHSINHARACFCKSIGVYATSRSPTAAALRIDASSNITTANAKRFDLRILVARSLSISLSLSLRLRSRLGATVRIATLSVINVLSRCAAAAAVADVAAAAAKPLRNNLFARTTHSYGDEHTHIRSTIYV